LTNEIRHNKSLLGCPFKMATIDTAIALALQQFKVDRLKAEQKVILQALLSGEDCVVCYRQDMGNRSYLS
jgi:hypothetical protein